MKKKDKNYLRNQSYTGETEQQTLERLRSKRRKKVAKLLVKR